MNYKRCMHKTLNNANKSCADQHPRGRGRAMFSPASTRECRAWTNNARAQTSHYRSIFNLKIVHLSVNIFWYSVTNILLYFHAYKTYKSYLRGFSFERMVKFII